LSRRDLLVAGSIALDKIEGTFGTLDDELGGSALYFALAASLIRPVRMVAPVGLDAIERVRRVVDGRNIDVTGIEVLDAPTYRWHAKQVSGRNQDLGSRDSIYDLWSPKMPKGFSGWAFVGSMRPDRQAQATQMLAGANLLAADAMLSYLAVIPEGTASVLRNASWYFCNHEEFAAVGGREPEDFRRAQSLQGLVVKAGPAGVTAYTDQGALHVPAVTGASVSDTTGAGDALAGGMLARWLETDGAPDQLGEAMVWGVACATIAVSAIGLAGLIAATPLTLRQKVDEVTECLRREGF
jgi:sugar/nucleoside kinase (ribokinase family)